MAASRTPRIRGIDRNLMETTLPRNTRDRDVRPLGERIYGALLNKQVAVFTMCLVTALTLLIPSFAFYLFILASFFTLWALTRPEKSPCKIPIQERTVDSNELHPGTGKPVTGKGIFFIGNDITTHKEVWVTNDDCRQHFLVMGTTGAGKTELLLSFSSNALSWGSGFLYTDGKADLSLYAKILLMCRRWGRDDDLLVLNFMTGDNKVTDVGGSGHLATNTMNPFANGSPDSLVQLVVSLMDGGGGGDNAMWVGRAQAMFTGIMYTLVWLRDAKGRALGVGDIRDHLQLGKIASLIDKNEYPDIPDHITKAIRAYLSSLAGWSWDKDIKKNIENPDVTKQHGFLEMQFTKIFSSLVDVYSSIFNTAYGDIDVYDVVLNRRVLVVMLPALEKAPPELASLGKIIVASFKGMMGSVLGSHLEGTWDDLVENRPTSSPSPFIVIFDEVGYYAVAGMAVMAAQGRSLGFSLVYASQDLNSLKRNEEKESESIIGNTNLKMLMRTEDKQTQELGVNAGGKEAKISVDNYEGEDGKWDAGTNAQTRMEDVINATDLKAQEAGYLHFIYKGTVVRARSFYADAPSSLEKSMVKIRPNHFIVVERGEAADLDDMKRNQTLLNVLASKTFDKDMRELVEYEMELLEESRKTSLTQNLGYIVTGAIRETRTGKEAFDSRLCKVMALLRKISSAASEKVNNNIMSILCGNVMVDGKEMGQEDDTNVYDENGSYFGDEDGVAEDFSEDDIPSRSPSVVINGDEYSALDDSELSQGEIRNTTQAIRHPGEDVSHEDSHAGVMDNYRDDPSDVDDEEDADALSENRDAMTGYRGHEYQGDEDAFGMVNETVRRDEEEDEDDEDIIISSEENGDFREKDAEEGHEVHEEDEGVPFDDLDDSDIVIDEEGQEDGSDEESRHGEEEESEDNEDSLVETGDGDNDSGNTDDFDLMDDILPETHDEERKYADMSSDYDHDIASHETEGSEGHDRDYVEHLEEDDDEITRLIREGEADGKPDDVAEEPDLSASPEASDDATPEKKRGRKRSGAGKTGKGEKKKDGKSSNSGSDDGDSDDDPDKNLHAF